MATLKLTIGDISVTTEMETANISFSTGISNQIGYDISLVDFSFQKKMYQPTELLADLQISKAEGLTIEWQPVGRKTIESTFKHQKVSLTVLKHDNNQGQDNEETIDVIGDDYYVHEVLPCYKSDSMIVKLKIYSLDKLLTLNKTCRTFVAKKLGSGILDIEIPKYKKPYNKNETLDCNYDGLQVLNYQSNENKVEHMFPYLVQYNESFYDMLIRTCNRWGEFVYWENGKLNIGYDSDESKVITIKNDYNTITYPNIDTSNSLVNNTGGQYFPVGADDSSINNSPMEKSRYIVKGKIGQFNGMLDVYIASKFSQFFANDKNLVSWILDVMVDDLVGLAAAESTAALRNLDYNDKYFPKAGATDEQYGKKEFKQYDEVFEEKEGINEFTEFGTKYNDAKYKEILEYEQKASGDVVVIDYDTTWPGLKLGNIIRVNGEDFIVNEISTGFRESSLVFFVTAIGKDQGQNHFYPTILPTGHVRYSGPQIATVSDAKDPTLKNRVRVVFPWQVIPKDPNKSDDSDEESIAGDPSPWLTFASSGGGSPMASKHNAEDPVLVGFIDGNIERPYVLGVLEKTGALLNNVHMISTPGGQSLSLTDGTGAGIVKMLSSALSPITKTITSFVPESVIPGLTTIDWKQNKFFEGGFSLSDRYGIYKISGSTDNRNITISSPWGNVVMNAFTGITISAPNGDVKISGKNVTIEAGNNLTLLSGKNIGYKIFNDKKFGSFSAASLGLTVVTEVANRLAQKLTLVDLGIVRSMVEVVLRPVEGALTVKSNRFLKLEAGKNSCEYPKVAFNLEKKRKLLDERNKKDMAESALLDSCIVDLFKIVKPLADTALSNFQKLYEDCTRKKELMVQNIAELATFANDIHSDVCKNYEGMKTNLWQKDVDEATVGFTNNVSIDEDDENSVSPVCMTRLQQNRNQIIRKRRELRDKVMDSAKDLRKAIVALQNFEITQKDVNSHIGFFRWTSLPQGAKQKMYQAVCKDTNPHIFIYDPKTRAIDLNIPAGYINNEKKFLHRLFGMNLLKEFGLDKERLANQANQVPPEPKVTNSTENVAGNLMEEATWRAYIRSLSPKAIIKKEKGLGKTLLDSFTGQFTKVAEDINFPKSYREMNAWSDGKNGKILIGANRRTYMIGSDDSNITFSEIEKLSPSAKNLSPELLEGNNRDKLINIFEDLIGELNAL